MKIHPSSPSPSTSSSSSSLHSTISSVSISSSSSASASASASGSTPISGRCHGLDLLVKAVYHVAGSVIGVPYIQRRVIRRRKPALRFDNLLINSHPWVRDPVDDLVVVKKVRKPRRQLFDPKDCNSGIIKRRRRRSCIPAA